MDPVWISTGVNFLLFAGYVGGGFVALGKFRAEVATKKELSERLYNQDGTTIFLPRAECGERQGGCSRVVCEKLEEMKTDSQRRHEEYLAANRDHLRQHEDLNLFVGAVRQFMKQQKGRQ